METLDELAYTGLQNYFHAVSVFGYKSYKEVSKLLTLLFIDDVLDGSLSYYVTDDDYRLFTEVLYNMFGTTCLVPYPEFKCNVTLNQDLTLLPRVSENNIIRISEDEAIRYAES